MTQRLQQLLLYVSYDVPMILLIVLHPLLGYGVAIYWNGAPLSRRAMGTPSDWMGTPKDCELDFLYF